MGAGAAARGGGRTGRRRLRRRQLRRLTRAQQAALDHVRARAQADAAEARRRIRAATADAADVDVASLAVAATARHPIALHFHPDRPAADGRLVAEALLADGVYRSQFETGISNGGLSAFPGGDRDRWEERLFGGAYQAPGVGAEERPRYGGLDLAGHADGPCPRFGSCHLRLRREVAARATFCFGDSHAAPTAVGTADVFEPVLAAIVEDDPGAVHRIDADHQGTGTNGRALDEYVEVQVHGAVRLDEDVEALVGDPSFQGTPIGDLLERLAARYDLALSWHEGFVLDAEEVGPSFRGPAVRDLARRLGGELHAERIGRAARPPEDLQHVKQLWHTLVAFGRPGPLRSR